MYEFLPVSIISRLDFTRIRKEFVNEILYDVYTICMFLEMWKGHKFSSIC